MQIEEQTAAQDFLAKAANHRQDLECLAFVNMPENHGGLLETCDFWCPPKISQEVNEFVLGAAYAMLAVGIARRLQWPGLIAVIIGDLAMKGRVTPLESGFLSRISSFAYVGSLN